MSTVTQVAVLGAGLRHKYLLTAQVAVASLLLVTLAPMQGGMAPSAAADACTLTEVGKAGGTYESCAYFSAATDSATWQVPANVTKVHVDMWGGGGGGPVRISDWSSSSTGAAGGYVGGDLAVTAGNNLEIVVAGGGSGSVKGVTAGTPAKGGGGAGGDSSTGEAYAGAGGGGYSGILKGADPLAIAGGGGGASTWADTWQPRAGGGGNTSVATTDTQGKILAGANGSDSQGGAGGRYLDLAHAQAIYQKYKNTLAVDGDKLQGGAGSSIIAADPADIDNVTPCDGLGPWEGGGGGGGGYYGGGGGTAQFLGEWTVAPALNRYVNGPGGGGSSYTPTGGTAVAGSHGNWANASENKDVAGPVAPVPSGSDPAEDLLNSWVVGLNLTAGSVAKGGDYSTDSAKRQGGNGFVLLRWKADPAPPSGPGTGIVTPIMPPSVADAIIPPASSAEQGEHDTPAGPPSVESAAGDAAEGGLSDPASPADAPGVGVLALTGGNLTALSAAALFFVGLGGVLIFIRKRRTN